MSGGDASASRPSTPGPGRVRLLGVVALLVCAAAVLWTLSRRTPLPPPPGDGQGIPGTAEADDRRWSVVLGALDAEREARQELAREVAELRDLLAFAGITRELDVAEPEQLAHEPSDPEVDPAHGAVEPAAGQNAGFDAEALVAVGFDPARADDLRELWEEHELEKLYLRDQAAREGWMTSPRHWREQVGLVMRFREEIGDEDYAAVLYASGKPNSVIVTDVLSRSPGGDAGLEPGDEIRRYDATRIFQPNGLRVATAAGEPGEFVSIEVVRDGRPLTFRIRRGPLGVLLRPATREP